MERGGEKEIEGGRERERQRGRQTEREIKGIGSMVKHKITWLNIMQLTMQESI